MLVNQTSQVKELDLKVYMPPNMGSSDNMMVVSLDAKGFFRHKCFKYGLAWQEKEGYEDDVNDGWVMHQVLPI